MRSSWVQRRALGGKDEAERPKKRARGECIGRDVKVKVIQAVKPKQFSKSAGARGLTASQQTPMAVFTHDESTQEQLVYFEETDSRPL